MSLHDHDRLHAFRADIADLDELTVYGRVASVRGLMIEVAGPLSAMHVGGLLDIEVAPGRSVPCEVVGFSGDRALVMPFGGVEGLRRGCRAVVRSAPGGVRPSRGWLGRVINAMGEPIDG